MANPQTFEDIQVTGTLKVGGVVSGGSIPVSFFYEATVADSSFFVADRAYRVKSIVGCVEVVGTDAGAVTAVIRKAPSATDIAAGTALHSGTFNLKGTVDTNQTLTLSTTDADLSIASGDRIGFDLTGVPTAARGFVTVLLAGA